MIKIQEHLNCIIATASDGSAYLITPNPPLEKWMDGACFEDCTTTGTPKEPGIYRVTIEVWFSQGYSDGYPAPGESNWELRFTTIEAIPIDGPAPLSIILYSIEKMEVQ